MNLPLDWLPQADHARYAAAGVAVVVFFLLVAALVSYGHELARSWFRVIAAVAFQQGVTVYVYVVRARATPTGAPDDRIDLSLAGLLISGVALLVCVLGVFASRHPEQRGVPSGV